MATVEHDLEQFMQFVQNRLGAGDADASLDELFDLWRLENPSEDVRAENVAAIAASISDFKLGERGSIAGEHSAELRRQFGLDGK